MFTRGKIRKEKNSVVIPEFKNIPKFVDFDPTWK